MPTRRALTFAVLLLAPSGAEARKGRRGRSRDHDQRRERRRDGEWRLRGVRPRSLRRAGDPWGGTALLLIGLGVALLAYAWRRWRRRRERAIRLVSRHGSARRLTRPRRLWPRWRRG